MVAGTLASDEESFAPSSKLIRIATTAGTNTYLCNYFAEIVGVVANNESDDDGVGIAVSGQTITITVNTATDVVTLLIFGRK